MYNFGTVLLRYLSFFSTSPVISQGSLIDSQLTPWFPYYDLNFYESLPVTLFYHQQSRKILVNNSLFELNSGGSVMGMVVACECDEKNH